MGGQAGWWAASGWGGPIGGGSNGGGNGDGNGGGNIAATTAVLRRCCGGAAAVLRRCCGGTAAARTALKVAPLFDCHLVVQRGERGVAGEAKEDETDGRAAAVELKRRVREQHARRRRAGRRRA
eukprot:541426-Prymnesium_polylepis.1